MENEEFEVFPVDAEDDDVVVTLDMDDGSEVDCEILTIFECGERDYIVLLPFAKDGKQLPPADNVYIYRYVEDEKGTPVLDNIASDEEYAEVSKRFEQWQDESEYDDED